MSRDVGKRGCGALAQQLQRSLLSPEDAPSERLLARVFWAQQPATTTSRDATVLTFRPLQLPQTLTP